MATDVGTRPITAEAFMAMDLGEGTFELVRGEVVPMPPPGPDHGRVCFRVGFSLELFGQSSGLGYVVSNDSAVQTEKDPDTVRGADLSFYRAARLPRSRLGRYAPPIPPDLAVEVVSPSNRPGEIAAKVHEYIAVGVSMVWVVNPETRTVLIYRPGQAEPIKLGECDTIEGLAELPGLRCPVADFFL